MKKPYWWPTNPYPEDIFVVKREDLKTLVPDELTRTKIAALLGRIFWDMASEMILDAMQAHDL